MSVSDPDSGFGGPESQSDSGSGCSHHKRLQSAARHSSASAHPALHLSDSLPHALTLARPLKGILKNPVCATLPRQHCSCSYLGQTAPSPPPPDPGPPPSSGHAPAPRPRVLRTLSQPEPGDLVYYSSANISTCDASEKLSQNEVLDTVESSV